MIKMKVSFDLTLIVIMFLLCPTSSQNIKFKFNKTSSTNFYFYGPSLTPVSLSEAENKCDELGFKILDFSFKGLEEEAIQKFHQQWNQDQSLGNYCFWNSNGSCVQFGENKVTYQNWGDVKRFICFKSKSTTPASPTTTITGNQNNNNNNGNNIETSTQTFKFTTTNKFEIKTTSTSFIGVETIMINGNDGNPGINKPLAIGLGIFFLLLLLIILAIFLFWKFNRKLKTKFSKSDSNYEDVKPNSTSLSTSCQKIHTEGGEKPNKKTLSNTHLPSQPEVPLNRIYENQNNHNPPHNNCKNLGVQNTEEGKNVKNIYYNENKNCSDQGETNYDQLNIHQMESNPYQPLQSPS